MIRIIFSGPFFSFLSPQSPKEKILLVINQ